MSNSLCIDCGKTIPDGVIHDDCVPVSDWWVEKDKMEKLLQESREMRAYLEGYRHGLDEAQRIDESLPYAASILLKLREKGGLD